MIDDVRLLLFRPEAPERDREAPPEAPLPPLQLDPKPPPPPEPAVDDEPLEGGGYRSPPQRRRTLPRP